MGIFFTGGNVETIKGNIEVKMAQKIPIIAQNKFDKINNSLGLIFRK
jgi:hypothetical protein